MNAPQPTALELYRADVLTPQKAVELFKSLPAHIKPSVFERNLLNALMANPDLMKFHPSLVYREVAKAAGLGLLLDPLLGEAYIVPAYNYKSGKTEPQLRVGYKGMIKLVRQTGNTTTVSCHEVHAHDEVEVDLGFPKVFHHRPKLFTERGPIMGYVAIIAFKDGTFDFEPMSVDQCHAIRDRSDAWKAFKAEKIKSTPWATDDSEMSKKTTLRRLMKRQEQSPELARANQIEDEAEFEEVADRALTDDGGGPPVPGAAPQLTHQEQVPFDGGGPPAPGETKPTAANDDGLDIPDYLRRTEEKPAESAISAAEQKWLGELETAFADCRDAGTLFEQNDELMQPKDGHVSTEAWNDACDILERHIQRLQESDG